MTPLDTLHPPAKPESDCALTSDQIDERVRRIGLQPPGPRREAVREETIRLLMPVAGRIAGKYRNYKGEDPDDLFQVACVGLVKAIDGYDPEHGHAFLSYAVPTISGELKRHLRDRSGVVRVPRAVQEVRQQARRAQLELEQASGGVPVSTTQIARACGLPEDTVAAALRAQDAERPWSLDAPPAGGGRQLPALCDAMGGQDHGIETAAERVALIDALKQFPERERRIVVLRFFHDQTQQQIAASVGVSQMHVSRLLSRCLAELRDMLRHLEPSPQGCRREESYACTASTGSSPGPP